MNLLIVPRCEVEPTMYTLFSVHSSVESYGFSRSWYFMGLLVINIEMKLKKD